MAERINPQQSSDVAGIALKLPTGALTTGAVLAALNAAWKAGYSEGFSIGLHSGQKHMADIMDTVYKSMSDV